MALKVVQAENPQQALGVFLVLAGFEYTERDVPVSEFFHRVYPSVANGHYLFLQDVQSDQYIGAAAWDQVAPMYAAISLNKMRALSPAEARSAGDIAKGQGEVVWHTFLHPYGSGDAVFKLLRDEIVKITGLTNNASLYQTYKRVKKDYDLLKLKST